MNKGTSVTVRLVVYVTDMFVAVRDRRAALRTGDRRRRSLLQQAAQRAGDILKSNSTSRNGFGSR